MTLMMKMDDSIRQDMKMEDMKIGKIMRQNMKMDDSMRQNMKMEDMKMDDSMRQNTELKIMEEKQLGKILQEQSTTNTSYIICYVVLIILVILGIVGYFYFR
jgi:hypothetical protein